MFAMHLDGDRWLEYKLFSPRISSTELSSLLGLNKYKSRRRLYFQKKEHKADYVNTVATRFGQENEPKGLEFFMEWAEDFVMDPIVGIDWRKPQILLDPILPLCISPDFFFKIFGRWFGGEIKAPLTRAIPQQCSDVYDEHVIQCFSGVHICNCPWFLFYFDPRNTDNNVIYVVMPVEDAFNDFGAQACHFIRDLLLDNTRYSRPMKQSEKLVNQMWCNLVKAHMLGPFLMRNYSLPVIIGCIEKHLPAKGRIPEPTYSLVSSSPACNQREYPLGEPHTSQSESVPILSEECSEARLS